MNRILYKRAFLFLLTFTLICWSIHPCFGRSSKPPTQPCANCHTGAAGSGSINITSLPPKYQTGEEYQISVSISHDGQKRWGFLLQARDGSGNLAGDFSSIDDNTQTFSGYISHTSSGTFQGQSNSANWDLKWTAPAADVGSITFTAYGNAANNNGANSGDRGYTATVAITAEEKATVVNIPDLNLRAALEQALGKNAGDAITDIELATLIELSAQESSITDLTGLEHCTGLTELNLWKSQISDILILANLTGLTGLNLYRNEISDISVLANLTNLTSLGLSDNQISDLSPLTNLANLTLLNLGGNEISDISPLTGLANLTWLSLAYNEISDITAVANLTNLTWLSLSGNQISGVSPLANLTNLTGLSLHYNQLSNVSPLANLTGLTMLHLNNNEISDIMAVANLTGLTELKLDGNLLTASALPIIQGLQAGGTTVAYDEIPVEVNIPDVNLRAALEQALGKNAGDAITDADLVTLIKLGALESSITDLTGIEHCTNLTELVLGNNQISDISAVANLTNLTGLFLTKNQISDLSPLANLTDLTGLTLSGNQISGVSPLANLTGLTYLELHDNQISDITAVANLTNLSLFGNQISDISAVSSLTNLTWLYLNNNQISDLSPLTNLANLTLLNLFGNPLNVAAYTTVIPALQARGVGVYFDANTAPVANSQSVTLDQGETKAITLTGSDPEGKSLTYSVTQPAMER